MILCPRHTGSFSIAGAKNLCDGSDTGDLSNEVSGIPADLFFYPHVRPVIPRFYETDKNSRVYAHSSTSILTNPTHGEGSTPHTLVPRSAYFLLCGVLPYVALYIEHKSPLSGAVCDCATIYITASKKANTFRVLLRKRQTIRVRSELGWRCYRPAQEFP